MIEKRISKRANGKKKVGTWYPAGISKTDQSFKDECDVNFIVRNFMKTGQITHLRHVKGINADLSHVGDFHETMNFLTSAQQHFESLPSHIRARFGNSPSELVAFLQDPKNADEAVKLGLAEKIQVEDTPLTPEKNNKPGSKPVSTGNKGKARVSPPSENNNDAENNDE